MITRLHRHPVLWISALLVATQVLSGCGKLKFSMQQQSQDLPASQGPGSVGLKTAQTLISSLEKVTGVSALTTNGVDQNLSINDQVTLSSGFLSKSPVLSSLTSTHLLVATALGSAFAREQIRKEAEMASEKRLLCGAVDFSKAPSVALTDSVVHGLIGKFAQQYLQRDPDPSEASAMKECVVAISKELGDGGSQPLRSLANQQAISSCIATAYLGSPDFLRQ